MRNAQKIYNIMQVLHAKLYYLKYLFPVFIWAIEKINRDPMKFFLSTMYFGVSQPGSGVKHIAGRGGRGVSVLGQHGLKIVIMVNYYFKCITGGKCKKNVISDRLVLT